jgi:DNA-binding transcriptional ArsR family regulator
MVGAKPTVTGLLERDGHGLEGYLRVLANPSRLRLLELLRLPRTVDEIQLACSRPIGGSWRNRPMTRQAVRNHLALLKGVGLIRVRLARRETRRPVQEFVTDHCRLFGIIEQLRALNVVDGSGIDPLETMELLDSLPPTWVLGAKLVFANGPQESHAVPLEQSQMSKGRGWVIGRAPKCQILLAYDPFVSRENSEIVLVDGAYHLLDLRTRRNATYVNWRPLKRGGEVVLRRGDVVRVGRSLLVFLDD